MAEIKIKVLNGDTQKEDLNLSKFFTKLQIIPRLYEDILIKGEVTYTVNAVCYNSDHTSNGKEDAQDVIVIIEKF